jgi:hypothetical protein
MAIGYLSNIDLNNNQVKDFKIDNVTSDPTGLSGEGQMIYRTDTNQMKFHTGSNTWVVFGTGSGSGTVTSVDISSSTGTITVGGGPITNTGTLTVNLPVTGVTAGSYTSADITVDTYGRITSATSSGGGTMTSWKIGSTTGTDQTVIDGQTVDVVGGTYISGSVGGTRTVTLDHDATTRSDSTSTASSNSFAVVNSVTTNGTGHVTGIDVKTVTVPDNNTTSLPIKNSAGTVQFTSTDVTGLRFTASGAASVVFTPASQLITISSTDTNTTYTLPVSAGGSNSAVVTLDGSSGTDSTVTFEGTTDEIAVTETIVSGTEGTIKIGLPDDVTIANDLTVDGVIIQTEASSGSPAAPLNIFAGEVQVPTATAGGNAPNLAQVNLLISGVGVFQGAYNASTNSPALSGGSNVALNLGDYFVVSVAGNNGGYFPSLEPGDFIFADAAIGAGTSPAVSAYTVVQADANIAGSGTTDGNTNKGVSGFDSANFTVSSNGWVQLNDQSITVATYGSATKTVALAINADGITTTAAEQDIAIPASQITDFCAAVDTCVADNGVTANIGNGSATAYVINHLLGTRNVIVSCFRNSSPWDTVFMDVERTDTNNVTLRTTTALTTNEVSVIITKVT